MTKNTNEDREAEGRPLSNEIVGSLDTNRKFEDAQPSLHKTSEEKLLDEFIEHEREKSRMGSGDDMFYEEQIINYINKQRAFWLDFIKFLQKRWLPADKAVLIEDVKNIIDEEEYPSVFGDNLSNFKDRIKQKLKIT